MKNAVPFILSISLMSGVIRFICFDARDVLGALSTTNAQSAKSCRSEVMKEYIFNKARQNRWKRISLPFFYYGSLFRFFSLVKCIILLFLQDIEKKNGWQN
jgi:hypothetical protein